MKLETNLLENKDQREWFERLFWTLLEYQSMQKYTGEIARIVSENGDMFGGHLGENCLKIIVEWLNEYVKFQKENWI